MNFNTSYDKSAVALDITEKDDSHICFTDTVLDPFADETVSQCLHRITICGGEVVWSSRPSDDHWHTIALSPKTMLKYLHNEFMDNHKKVVGLGPVKKAIRALIKRNF